MFMLSSPASFLKSFTVPCSKNSSLMPIVLHGIYIPPLLRIDTIISPAPPRTAPSSTVIINDLSFNMLHKYSLSIGLINRRLIRETSLFSLNNFLYAGYTSLKI